MINRKERKVKQYIRMYLCCSFSVIFAFFAVKFALLFFMCYSFSVIFAVKFA